MVRARADQIDAESGVTENAVAEHFVETADTDTNACALVECDGVADGGGEADSGVVHHEGRDAVGPVAERVAVDAQSDEILINLRAVTPNVDTRRVVAGDDVIGNIVVHDRRSDPEAI